MTYDKPCMLFDAFDEVRRDIDSEPFPTLDLGLAAAAIELAVVIAAVEGPAAATPN